MKHLISMAGAAIIAAAAFIPSAAAVGMAHGGHGGGGIHMGGNFGGGAHFNAAPHFNMQSHPMGTVKHWNGGGNPIALAPHRQVNPGPGPVPGHVVTQRHFDKGVARHVERHFDHDGDHPQHHRHHRNFFVYGYPSNDRYYDYSSYNDGTCGYYWNRYLRTGNLKWKYRYYDCIG